MTTSAGYVIVVALTAVCLVAAWPQHRSTQASNRDDYKYDRVVWGSAEMPYLQRVTTPANSTSPSLLKLNTRRSQRLQTGFRLEQDNDTRPKQARGTSVNQEMSATSRVTQSEQVVVTRQSNRTTPQRSASSSQQEFVRPSFQPRAHQSPVNNTRQAAEGREMTRAQNGGRTTTNPRAAEGREMARAQTPASPRAAEGRETARAQNGARTTASPRAKEGREMAHAQNGGRTTLNSRGAMSNVTVEGDRSREMVPEGRGLPDVRTNRSRDDIEVAASQDAGARSRHVDPLAAERNLPRWESNKGTRVNVPSENIVFPGPSQKDKHNSHRKQFTPAVVGKRPRCAGNTTFCEDGNNDYPIDYLNKVLEEQSVVFRNYFATDVVPEANNISQRFDDAQDDSPMCVSETHIVFPKVGQNKDNDWLYIVNLNADMFRQGVRIETCRNPDQPCAYSEGFPATVTTFCKQKYIYRQMLAVTRDGTPKADAFKLPSCCACHTISRGDTVSRMGLDPNRQSPARRKRRS